jgi:hypothetical protein
MRPVTLNRVVLVFAVVFAGFWLWNLVRKALAVRSAARRILASLRETFAAEHELTLIAHLPDEARAPLDTLGAALAPLGLERICDFEDVDVRRAAGVTIPIRAFASPSEPLGALAYHHPQLDRVLLDVRTSLSDGRTLITTTAVEATKLASPPELERQALPGETAPAEVVASHRRWLDQLLADTPGLTATASRTPDEVLAQARREQRSKHEHRERVGWITFDEMVAMSRGRQDVARLTHAAIQRELAKQSRQPSAGC